MSDTDKRKVLRYAELAFRAQRNQAKKEDASEMAQIRVILDMTHEAILELAVKKLFPED